MATLKRQTALLFAGNADVTDLGDFGSAKGGTPTNPTAPSDPTDPSIEEQIQTAAYENGWTDAVVTTKNFPPIEEVNGVLRTISYQTCYLLQEGIPTWDANTEYSATSIVKSINSNELAFYLSKVDNNIGNPINDTTKWVKAIITGDREVGVPQITLDFSGSLPANCVDLRGQRYKITSEPTDPDYKYQRLYSIYGISYKQQGDPNGTFRVPDFYNNMAFYGGASAGYIAAGLPDLNIKTAASGVHTHTASTGGAGSHSHNKGNMRIYGQIKTNDSDDEPLLFSDSITTTGALKVGGRKSWDYGGAETKSGTSYNVIAIDSNDYWTGNTNTEPNHTHSVTIQNSSSHTHTITTSSIVGSADSVYAKGIKVRVFTRYQ